MLYFLRIKIVIKDIKLWEIVLKEKLINGKESCYKSKNLATIVKDINLNFTLEDCKYLGINKYKGSNILYKK